MNQGKYVFAQLTDFLPQRLFDRCVEKYSGNARVRLFSCWNQMLCMMFGQLSGRESLSDLISGINAHRGKSYHLGLGSRITKSNLAKANKRRDWRIFAEFAYCLINQARKICMTDKDFAVAFDGPVFAFDSTTIDLCLNIFWWAAFRKAKAGIKLNTLYDVKTSIPTLIKITDALTHDVAPAIPPQKAGRDSWCFLCIHRIRRFTKTFYYGYTIKIKKKNIHNCRTGNS